MRRLSPVRFDVALTCGFVLVALLEAWLSAGDDDPLLFLLASAAILPLPLLVRRQRPVLAVCGVLVVMVVQRLVLGEIWDAGSSLAVPMCAVFSAGAYLPRGLGAAAAVGVIVTTSIADVGEDGSDWPFLTLVFGAMWAAGLAARRYRELAERTAAYAEELRACRPSARSSRLRGGAHPDRARAARRGRPRVASIVVQAEAGQALIERDRPARRALDAIQDTGRQALVELRRLLGVLRERRLRRPERPQPSLGTRELVEEVRARGLRVDLEIEGDPRRAPARRRPGRLPDRAGGADQHGQARRRRHARGRARATRRRGADRGRRRRRGARPRSGRARAASAWRAGRAARGHARGRRVPAAAATASARSCRSGQAMIRVLSADDQELVRAGFAADPRRRAGHRGGRRGRRRRAQAVERRGALAPGRGADGHPDAGHGRHRGDPAARRAPGPAARCSC